MIKGIKLHKLCFYLVVFLLPINLGKHFIFKWSYVGGILVDYLIPTLFVVDIALVFLAVLWLWDFNNFKRIFRHSIFKLSLVFLLTAGLSVISAYRREPALYALLRLILYFMFFFYVTIDFDFKEDFRIVLNILGFWVFFLSLLGALQWLKQGSVFNNYYILGEQPYTASTKGIGVENVLASSKIPPYGLFRHPNIFGGFLSITLFWFIVFYDRAKKWMKYLIPLGTLVLFLTLSLTAIFSFVYAVVCSGFLKMFRAHKMIGVALILTSALVIVVGSIAMFGFGNLPVNHSNTSFYRRVNLQSASIEVMKRRFLFGAGLNNAVISIDTFYKPVREIRFIQPVHNIFLLVFAETGVFGFLSFLSILLYVLYVVIKRRNYLFLISLLQILIIGSFDHYFLTIHQTLLLFLLTLGTALKYN